jgi:hypothetical protein
MRVFAAIGAALLLAGCGAETRVETVTDVRTVTAEEPTDTGPKSAATKTVEQFWNHLAAGAVLVALDTYEPRVVASLGAETLGTTLVAQQSTAQAYELEVKSEEKLRTGTLVVVALKPESGPVVSGSFMVRNGRIVYDNLTASAFAAHVQQQVQARIDPEAKEPSRRAVEAGEAAFRRFRQASRAAIEASS